MNKQTSKQTYIVGWAVFPIQYTSDTYKTSLSVHHKEVYWVFICPFSRKEILNHLKLVFIRAYLK